MELSAELYCGAIKCFLSWIYILPLQFKIVPMLHLSGTQWTFPFGQRSNGGYLAQNNNNIIISLYRRLSDNVRHFFFVRAVKEHNFYPMSNIYIHILTMQIKRIVSKYVCIVHKFTFLDESSWNFVYVYFEGLG